MSQMDGSVSATAEDLDEGSRLIEGMASQSLHTNAFPHYEATGSQYGRRYEIRCEGGNYDNSYQSYGASNFGWWCCVETHWAVSPAIAKGTERKAPRGRLWLPRGGVGERAVE